MVEDSETDAALIEEELRSSGLNPWITRVESEKDVRAGLREKPELIIADYELPGFTAMEVLEWFKEAGMEVPFVLVSGTIDTETAVASMRKGANDYILKSNLSALGRAISRTLEAHRLRQAQRDATEKAAFLGHILNLAQDAIIVCDFEDNRIHFWNSGAQRLYGWPAGEVMGQKIDSFINLAEQSEMMKGLLRNGEWNAEVQRTLRNGRQIVISERATLARDIGGNPTAILIIDHDITEQKRAEEKVRYQESLIRETGEVARIGSWQYTVAADKLFWTPEIARIFGLPVERASDMKIRWSVFRGEHREQLDRAFQAAIEEAKPFDLELQITVADDARKWVRFVGHPVREQQKVVKVHGIIQDITDQRVQEDQLRERGRLLNLATDAILVSDFETGKIIYWNQGAERMHGWTEEEVLGKNPTELLLVDEAKGREILRDVTLHGEWNGEVVERTKDGREITVSSRVTLVTDDAGRPKSLLSIHTDITERNTLKTQFLRAQRLESVGTLASGVAHDLNNILSPIILAGPMLANDLPPALRKSIVDTINIAARRGAEIVRQVLTFARGVKGELRPVDCERLIQEILSITAETFSKSIHISSKAKSGLWLVLGDSTQLQQVLLNLAINARDAMPNGGTLTIQARNFAVDESFASMTPEAKVGRYVAFQITDTGVGIPREFIDKIFDPFFTTKEIGHGTGLGLSTVLGIVRNHGGFVTVESGSGRGSTFKIFIPAMESGDGVIPDAEPSFAPPRGAGEMLLLADDEPNIRRVAEAVLKQAGYRVLLAADGAEAIARYAENRSEIKIVITDAVMPLLDGVGLTRALRHLDPGIKVIGTSGQMNDQRVNDLKSLGLQGFLDKPYDTHSLLVAIREALDDSKV
jgi:PAS domain S-box-containing protein